MLGDVKSRHHRTYTRAAASALYITACGTPSDSDTQGSTGGGGATDVDTSSPTSEDGTPTAATGATDTSGCIPGGEGCACVDSLCLGGLQCLDGVCSDGSTETSGTDGCVPGGEGCACVDGLCLGDLQCHAGLCEGVTENCEGVIQGSVAIVNSAQLDQLVGVRQVTGSVSIAPNLGPVPQLSCLEEAVSLSLGEGNDYSAMQSFRTAAFASMVGGPGTILPSLSELLQLEQLALRDVEEVLLIPKVQGLSILSLSSSAAPDFAGQVTALDLLTLSEGQGNYASLDGSIIDRLNVQDFMGTELPLVKVETLLSINGAPNLTMLSLELGDTFPINGPKTLDEEGNSGIQLYGTGLKNLDDLAGISTYTARSAIYMNDALLDISGLTGATVALAYDLPPEFVSFNVSYSPLLCLTQAQAVAETMTVPTFVGLYFLKESC